MARKPGRPRLTQDPNLDGPTQGGSNYRGIPKRDVQANLGLQIRQRTNPAHIIKFWEMIAEGISPVFIRDKKTKEICGVEPDPSPLQPSPTLEQKASAIRELTNRGWGQAPQAFQIETTLKLQIQNEIPAHLLQHANFAALAKIREALRLEDGNTEDAEWTPVPVTTDAVQEPGHVENPTKSESQETANSVPTSADVTTNNVE